MKIEQNSNLRKIEATTKEKTTRESRGHSFPYPHGKDTVKAGSKKEMQKKVCVNAVIKTSCKFKSLREQMQITLEKL